MNAVRLAFATSVLSVALACTPLAPSVHKSVFRRGEPIKSTTGPIAPSPTVRALLPGSSILELEAFWVRDDEALTAQLEGREELRRLSADELKEIQNLGPSVLAHFDPLEGLNPDKLKTGRDIRIVARVQLQKARFDELIKTEASSWAFGLDRETGKLSVAHESEQSVLAGHIVNLYLVLD